MRLLFDTICLAVASVGTHAGTSGLSVGQVEGPTNRYLRVHDPAHGHEEERVTAQFSGWIARAVRKRDPEEIDALALESESNAKRLKMDEASTSDHSNLFKFHLGTGKAPYQTILDEWQKDIKKILESKAPLLKSLTKKYGDDGVTKIIATNVGDTASMAWHLQRLRDKLDPDELFARLQLIEPDASKLLQKWEMLNWIEYANYFNKEFPEKAKTLRERLQKYEDMELVDMVYSASKSPRRLKPAKQMLNVLIEIWLRSKFSGNDVFGLLVLRPNVKIDFRHPRFDEWMQYVTDLSVILQTQVSYFFTLTQRFDEEVLVEMLQAAGKDSRTKRLALDFKKYLENEAPNRADVAKYVKPLQELMDSIPVRFEQPKQPRKFPLNQE